MWLFDTVALSESAKARMNPGFADWAETLRASDVHTSVLCLGEIRRGVVMTPGALKQAELARWLEVDLPQRLGKRVLPVDGAVAQAWGRLGARGGGASAIDALIGATALAHGLSVVTRNVKDFDGLGVAVVNPWS